MTDGLVVVTFLMYGLMALVGAVALVAVGYFIRAAEDRPRRARDRRLIEGLRAHLKPHYPPRGKHAASKEGPDD